jgi:hypothetical protein
VIYLSGKHCESDINAEENLNNGSFSQRNGTTNSVENWFVDLLM